MSNLKPMSILLLEDDISTINDFKNYINSREDVKLIAETNSCEEALNLVGKLKPEAVIVDLELQDGSGSGFDFLVKLKSLTNGNSPLVVVNTNVYSSTIYKNLHNGFANLIFYKQQKDYSIEMVINTILFSRTYDENSYDIIVKSTEEDKQKRLEKLVDSELDKFKINYKYKGRNYIKEALIFMLNQEQSKLEEVSVLQYVGSLHHMYPDSIGRGIQTAINNVWKNTPVEDLEVLYTSVVRSSSGTPSSVEFVTYLYNKIRDKL